MPRQGQKSVTISGGKLRELEQNFGIEKKKRPDLSFASFVSELALIELERRNMLREAAFISLAAAPDGNGILLRDATRRTKYLKCRYGPIKNCGAFMIRPMSAFM